MVTIRMKGVEEALGVIKERPLVLPGGHYLHFTLVRHALAWVLGGHVCAQQLLFGERLIADFARI